jgi:hypothetical protein
MPTYLIIGISLTVVIVGFIIFNLVYTWLESRKTDERSK